MPAQMIHDKFPLATWGAESFEEIGPATDDLKDGDVHFGINGYISQLLTPHAWGAREADATARGGKVAEVLWWEWYRYELSRQEASNRRQPPPDIKGTELGLFLEYHDNVIAREAKPKTLEFKAGAKMGGKSIAGQPKYVTDASKARANIAAQPRNAPTTLNGTAGVWATRFCKAALRWAVYRGGRVHFHLDGMGDVKQVRDKGGEYSHNITSHEFRYVCKNWGSIFSAATFIYNGFAEVNGKQVAVRVKPKW